MAVNPRTYSRGYAGMLTVACVLKSGGIYTADWVSRLRNGVSSHLNIDHRFVCLTDALVPCQSIPLDHNWPGWWSKIELFRIPGPVLYFDLDTLIVGDITEAAEIAVKSEKLLALENFYQPGHIGSGVMGWGSSAPVFDIYRKFRDGAQHFMETYEREGDQKFILDAAGEIRRWQDTLPGQFVSYKCDVRRPVKRSETGTGDIPENARVVCLHGAPKFAEMSADDPVRMIWERAA